MNKFFIVQCTGYASSIVDGQQSIDVKATCNVHVRTDYREAKAAEHSIFKKLFPNHVILDITVVDHTTDVRDFCENNPRYH